MMTFLLSSVLQMMEDGKTLIVVHMAAGQLFSIDVETGASSLIDLGGVLVHGDGLVSIE